MHAIGAGCLLLEAQQTSNTTYRLYDWGRKGADGKTRELHVDQALQVIDWEDRAAAKVYEGSAVTGGEGAYRTVYRSPYFKMEHARFAEAVEGGTDGTTFEVLFCASGRAYLRSEAGRKPLRREPVS